MSNETQLLSIDKIIAGKHYVQVDAIPDPEDPGSVVEIYEQVIMIEDMGQRYKVMTEHNEIIVGPQDIEVKEHR